MNQLSAFYNLDGPARTAHQAAHAPAFSRYIEIAAGADARIRVKKTGDPATTYSIIVGGEETEAVIDRRLPLALQLERFDYWLKLARGWGPPHHTPPSLGVQAYREGLKK